MMYFQLEILSKDNKAPHMSEILEKAAKFFLGCFFLLLIYIYLLSWQHLSIISLHKDVERDV